MASSPIGLNVSEVQPTNIPTALEIAARHVKNGGQIWFTTDASPPLLKPVKLLKFDRFFFAS